MARKSALTDAEISLIKALLSRGYKNGDIQFFFNKPDRKVNSGRITEIKSGKKGTSIEAASDTDLDHFLATAAPSHTAVVTVLPPQEPEGPLSKSRLLALFERRPDGHWYLRDSESVNCEAKANFWPSPLDKLAPAARAMAAFANSTGGYIFFGVDDGMRVVGMTDDRFVKTDPALLSQAITGCLDPAPVYHRTHLDIEGKSIGVMYVESSLNKPIICLKNAGKLSEGSIYYRYPGESKAIKPGDLRNIIADREAKAVADFARKMGRMASGLGAFLDLEENVIDGQRATIQIDQNLASQLQFIKEGEFCEKTGAPALRLVGDVVASDKPDEIAPKIVRDNITDDSVLTNFLKQISVESPIQYIKHSCHSSKKWLPVFYYAQISGRDMTELEAILKGEVATHPSSQTHTLGRLRGKRAFKKASGTPQRLLRDLITAQAVPPPTSIVDARDIATAIQSLETSEVDFGYVAGILLACHALAKGPGHAAGNLRSAVYKGACRLDELRFAP